MRARTVLTLASACALVALVLAPALLLPVRDAGSTLAPGPADSRVVTLERRAGTLAPEAGGAPATFAFTRPLELDASRDALVVSNPGVGYANEEVEALRYFLAGGGRVLIVDDAGVSADLLERLGAGVTMGKARVYTPAFHVTPRDLVAVSTGVLPALPAEVVLSRPALVYGGEPVLRAPDLAWEDANDNGRPDIDERVQRGFVVAARARVGAGEIVVVGDPDAVDRERFPVTSAALLAHVSEDGARRLVFDEAHRPFSDATGLNAVFTGRASAPVNAALLTLTLITAGALVLAPRFERAAERKRRRAPRGVDPDVLATVIGELDAK